MDIWHLDWPPPCWVPPLYLYQPYFTQHISFFLLLCNSLCQEHDCSTPARLDWEINMRTTRPTKKNRHVMLPDAAMKHNERKTTNNWKELHCQEPTPPIQRYTKAHHSLWISQTFLDTQSVKCLSLSRQQLVARIRSNSWWSKTISLDEESKRITLDTPKSITSSVTHFGLITCSKEEMVIWCRCWRLGSDDDAIRRRRTIACKRLFSNYEGT